MDEFRKFSQAIDSRDRQKNQLIMQLKSDLEAEKNKSKDYAQKFNEATTQHNRHLEKVNILRWEKENLEKRVSNLEKGATL